LNIYPISTVYFGGSWSQTSLFELVEPIFVFIMWGLSNRQYGWSAPEL